MFGLISGFWKGFWAPIGALRLIAKSPWMLALVAVPLAINIFLYALFFHYGAQYLDQTITEWLTRMAATMPAWLVDVSRLGLKLLAWLTLALVAALTFTIISGIVAAPFNDHLSRATLKARLRELGAELPGPATELSMGQTIRLEFKRMLVLIAGTICAVIIGLIPFLQLPALALGAWVVSFEYFGYPISQRTDRLLPVVYFTLRHPAISLGHGTFLLLIMALPFTSVFYIPLAVVAGTTLYVDTQLKLPNSSTRKKT